MKPWFFFRLLLSNCLNWKIHCDDHSSLSHTYIHTYIHTYFICNSPKGLFSYKSQQQLTIKWTSHVLNQVVGAKSAGKPQSQKIISLANHNTRRQSNGPIASRINTTGHPAGALTAPTAGNVRKSRLVLVSILSGCKKCRESFKQITLRTHIYIYSFNSQRFTIHHRGPRLTTAYWNRVSPATSL